jgi:hypothetical protein
MQPGYRDSWGNRVWDGNRVWGCLGDGFGMVWGWSGDDWGMVWATNMVIVGNHRFPIRSFLEKDKFPKIINIVLQDFQKIRA